MEYSPKPVTEYMCDGWRGPGAPFKDTPAFWNLAWLLLPKVEGDPKLWIHHPIQDDIVAHVWPEIYTSAMEDYPLVAARTLAALEGHAIQKHWSEVTVPLMMERARCADARLRAGQRVANVVAVDFVLRRRA